MSHVACGDCTNNCVRIHQANKNPTSKVIRFFKVMFGKDHDKFMELPLDFAPNMENMAGKSFLLKDTDGGKWSVLLSHVEGSLAFTSGWPLFFRDHNLEEASFLIFEYMEGSISLFVRVFEKSGCEAISFNGKDSFGRRVSSTEEADPDNKDVNDKSSTVLRSDLKGAMVEMASPIEASVRIQRESATFDEADKSGEDDGANRIPTCPEPMKIADTFDTNSAKEEIDSDVGSVDEVVELDEDCDSETPVDKPKEDAINLEKASGFKANGSGIRITERNKREGDVAAKNMSKLRKVTVSKDCASDIGIARQAKAQCDEALETKGNSQKASVSKLPIVSSGQALRKDCGEPAKKFINKTMPDFSAKSRKRIGKNGKRSTVWNKELIKEAKSFIAGQLDQRGVRKRPNPEKVSAKKQSVVVKVEPDSADDNDDDDQNVTLGSFAAIVESEQYLELPRGVRNYSTRGHVIYLKGPNGRKYLPVLCKVRKFEKTLVANWEYFCTKNNITEGDTCRFLQIDAARKLYKVDVEHK